MNKNGPSDKEIIERFVAGDKSLVAILVKRWHGKFCEKAYWIVRDRELAKDVAQDSWIVIFNKLHTLKNIGSFKSWALRIIYTKAIDAHRLRLRRNDEVKNVKYSNVASPEKSKDETIKSRMLQAILELTKDKQDVIRLFYVEEYSLKEISAILEIPIGTAKSRLFKAREKLKLILKNE